MTVMSEGPHCDDFIDDKSQPMPLRQFLDFHRAPAVTKGMLLENGFKPPKLFANYKGLRVRVVMASRLGDVGISNDLAHERSYSNRVYCNELSNFSDKP